MAALWLRRVCATTKHNAVDSLFSHSTYRWLLSGPGPTWEGSRGVHAAAATLRTASGKTSTRAHVRTQMASQADEHVYLPRIAIIGRPNVGKSTLFNTLTRRRAALVYDSPDGHVTRDYKEAVASLSDLRFIAVDTSGLEPFMSHESIQGRATAITRAVWFRAHQQCGARASSSRAAVGGAVADSHCALEHPEIEATQPERALTAPCAAPCRC